MASPANIINSGGGSRGFSVSSELTNGISSDTRVSVALATAVDTSEMTDSSSSTGSAGAGAAGTGGNG